MDKQEFIRSISREQLLSLSDMYDFVKDNNFSTNTFREYTDAWSTVENILIDNRQILEAEGKSEWEIFGAKLDYAVYITYDVQRILYFMENTRTKIRTLVDLLSLTQYIKEGTVILANPEFIQKDLQLVKERDQNRTTEQYEQYKKTQIKCDLLQIECTDIRKEAAEYVIYKLVPDNNGVATIPDFVTKVDRACCDNNQKYTYTKIIWRNPLVLEVPWLISHNKNIVNLDLSEFNFDRILSTRGLFDSCYKLQSINFGNNHFRNTVDMQSMFAGCRNLKEINMEAKCRGHVNLMCFAHYTFALEKLNLENSSYYTEMPCEVSNKIKNSMYLCADTTGKNSVSGSTVINLKATSLEHILTMMESSQYEARQDKIICLNELTGINLLGGFVPSSYVRSDDPESLSYRMKYQRIWNKEPGKYRLAINSEYRIAFVYSGFETSRFYRCGVSYKIQPGILERIETFQKQHHYKHRLVICNFDDMGYNVVIYFNKFSEWAGLEKDYRELM